MFCSSFKLLSAPCLTYTKKRTPKFALLHMANVKGLNCAEDNAARFFKIVVERRQVPLLQRECLQAADEMPKPKRIQHKAGAVFKATRPAFHFEACFKDGI